MLGEREKSIRTSIYKTNWLALFKKGGEKHGSKRNIIDDAEQNNKLYYCDI